MEIFTNIDLIRQGRTYNPYTACTQINMNQGDEKEDRMLDQQDMGISGNKNVVDGEQGNERKCGATKSKFTQCRQNSRKGKIVMR